MRISDWSSDVCSSDLVIDEGVAAKVLNPGKQTFAELSKLSGAKIAADKASLPKLAVQAKSAANGKLALATADAYLGYKDYAQAAALYQLALTKGGSDETGSASGRERVDQYV